MPVLPEERIVAYLERSLSLSQALLPSLLARGTEDAGGTKLEEYKRLLADLARERENDAYLSDESWDWIWKGKPSYNYLQLYGRLAWINLQLFDLL
jgi:hypothetical protein